MVLVQDQFAKVDVAQLGTLPEAARDPLLHVPTNDAWEYCMLVMLQYQSLRSYPMYSEDEEQQQKQLNWQKGMRSITMMNWELFSSTSLSPTTPTPILSHAISTPKPYILIHLIHNSTLLSSSLIIFSAYSSKNVSVSLCLLLLLRTIYLRVGEISLALGTRGG